MKRRDKILDRDSIVYQRMKVCLSTLSKVYLEDNTYDPTNILLSPRGTELLQLASIPQVNSKVHKVVFNFISNCSTIYSLETLKRFANILVNHQDEILYVKQDSVVFRLSETKALEFLFNPVQIQSNTKQKYYEYCLYNQNNYRFLPKIYKVNQNIVIRENLYMETPKVIMYLNAWNKGYNREILTIENWILKVISFMVKNLDMSLDINISPLIKRLNLYNLGERENGEIVLLL